MRIAAPALLSFSLTVGCTIGGLESSPPGAGVFLSDCGRHVVDGEFGGVDSECPEWAEVTPMRGTYGDLYVDVDRNSDLVVLNDWHLRDDAPATDAMYNLFCLATDLGVFEIRVFGDQHVEAWLNGENIDDQVEGAAGFASSPLTEEPHTIFEFRLASLPTSVRILECDPAGGTLVEPAPPPSVSVRSGGSCFPGNAPEVLHNLVEEPTVFDFELSPEGVVSARTVTEPLVLGVQPRDARAGDTLTIYGSQLGEEGAVFFGDQPALVESWSEAAITVVIPEPRGDTLVVDRGGVRSNALSLPPVCGDCEPGFVCDAATATCRAEQPE